MANRYIMMTWSWATWLNIEHFDTYVLDYVHSTPEGFGNGVEKSHLAVVYFTRRRSETIWARFLIFNL